MDRDISLRDACNEACRRLPDGFSIVVSLERDAGDVQLYDSENEFVEFPSNRETIVDQLADALDEAERLDREFPKRG